MNKALRRQLLIFVLIVVLAWYTFVIPPGAPAAARGRGEARPDAEDGDLAFVGEGCRARLRLAGAAPTHEPAAEVPVDELDWPDVICAEEF